MYEENMTPETTRMTVNEKMKADLLSSAKWAKFLTIVACIGMVFIVLVAILLLAFGSALSSVAPNVGPTGLLSFIYFVVAAIYIYPIIKGFQFANATKEACLSNNENELARGFDGMRSVLKFMGIITIIILSLYALIFVIAIIAGISIAALH